VKVPFEVTDALLTLFGYWMGAVQVMVWMQMNKSKDEVGSGRE